MDLQELFNARQSRRSLLQTFGMLAGGSLLLDACSPNSSSPPPSKNGPASIKHVLVACQENRSFDEYFGYYPRAGKFGIPASYSQPDGNGGTVTPYHFFFPFSN